MFLGIDENGQPVNMQAADLLTHGVVLGTTGSGKSGLTIALLEEISNSGASAIVFDPKGDLTNLALTPFSKEELSAWVDSDQCPTKLFEERAIGLATFGHSHESVANWRNNVNVEIYAPGKTFGGGKSINVFPTFQRPSADGVSLHVRASRDVGSVLEAIGEPGDPYSPALVFLSEAVIQSWNRYRALPMSLWPGVLANPPQDLQQFGGMELAEFFPKRNRTKLGRKLIGFSHQADRWLSGEQLDLQKLVTSSKPTIVIFTMRHLSEEERQFFTGLMMNRIVDFMFETKASKQLKLLIAIDEARGYLPPHPYNPPTKAPICQILAQGRAQGIGMLIGTQNPMDLDYKALSNVGTWFIGKLRERDCDRDLVSELKSRDVDLQTLKDLPQRRFLLLDKYGSHKLLEVRWTFSYLKGPLSAQDLLRISPVPKIIQTGQIIKPNFPAPPPAAMVDKNLQKARRAFWGRIFDK